MENSVKALVYSRVSTDAQGRDGTSLDTQERACVAHAQSKVWQIVEFIRDSASGFNLDRPGIDRVRQLLRHVAVEYRPDCQIPLLIHGQLLPYLGQHTTLRPLADRYWSLNECWMKIFPSHRVPFTKPIGAYSQVLAIP